MLVEIGCVRTILVINTKLQVLSLLHTKLSISFKNSVWEFLRILLPSLNDDRSFRNKQRLIRLITQCQFRPGFWIYRVAHSGLSGILLNSAGQLYFLFVTSQFRWFIDWSEFLDKDDFSGELVKYLDILIIK